MRDSPRRDAILSEVQPPAVLFPGHPRSRPLGFELVWLVPAGVVPGLIWHVVVPRAIAASDEVEHAASVDGSFALITALAGAVTAAAVWRRPGSRPAARLAVVLAGSWLAAGLAVGVSIVLGGPRLSAWGATVVWPVVTALGAAISATLELIFRSDTSERASEKHANSALSD